MVHEGCSSGARLFVLNQNEWMSRETAERRNNVVTVTAKYATTDIDNIQSAIVQLVLLEGPSRPFEETIHSGGHKL